jgi:predicted Zn-dependent protease
MRTPACPVTGPSQSARVKTGSRASARVNRTAAAAAGTVAAGYIDARVGSRALATSGGLFGFHRSTGVASTLTARTPDGASSGWAGDEANDWDRIESDRIAADAVAKCNAWRAPTALEPGVYETVLKPTAVGMLMLRMRGAFSARTADEGRSAFSRPGGGTLVGERLFDARVTIRSDPAAPNAETSPFADDGVPTRAQTWVEDGVLRGLSYSRFWADRQGVEPRPSAANLIMAGGDASVEEMIRSVRRGVLITRFWYIRPLNPRTISYTGITRDGTFLIENGRITRPVNNFRFNQSLVELLDNVDMLGTPTRVAAGENSSVGVPIVVPALKVRAFNLSSVSDAI